MSAPQPTPELTSSYAGRSLAPQAGSQQQVVLHGEGQQEHSLCGMAFDAYDSGDADEPIIFAKSGEVVTCPECRAELDFMRRCYKRYRYEPKVQNDRLQ